MLIVWIVPVYIIIIIVSYYIDNSGIYIKNNEVYNKFIKCRKVDINSIAGIKIINADNMSLYGGAYLNKCTLNKKEITKETLKTMICVKGIKEEMNKSCGDFLFKTNFKDEILFWTIYDKDFVNFLIDKNKNIKLF